MADITFILPHYPWVPIGGFRVVYEYANNLSNKGHNVSIIHPLILKNLQHQKNLNIKLKKKLHYLKILLFQPNISWQFIDKKVRMMFINEPVPKNIPDGDFVFATSWETAEYVNEYPASKGEKYYLIQDYEIFSGTSQRIEKTWNFPFKKIFISKWLYKKGLSLGLSPLNTCQIPNGIDHKKYTLINNIENRQKQIAMLYHPSPRKGSQYGIKALEISKKNHKDLNAVLFGTAPRPKSLAPWITYVKNPPQEKLIMEIYNKSSIYLCPSLYEGWGLPGIEAMSCGCALISTESGGVTDYAIQNENALLSQPKDIEKMVKNICLLLDNDKKRVSLAKNGYNHIQKFNWDASTKKLIDFMGIS